MAGKIEKKNRKSLWLVIAALCVAAAVVVVLRLLGDKGPLGTPTLTVETPEKCSAGEEITLDVTISDMGEALYPAASMSIRFDPACLEFLAVDEGNVFILDGESTSGRQLPQWSYNTAACNESGLINIMYLDMTGGRYAFSRELLAEEDNVVLRLKFRLRGSVRSGDICDLIFDDAVFAASDETQSLAMTTDTLNVRDGKIVIGE